MSGLRLVSRPEHAIIRHAYSDACVCVSCADRRKDARIALKRQVLLQELDAANKQDAGAFSPLVRTGDVVTSVDQETRYVAEPHAGGRVTFRREIPKVRGKAARRAAKRARRG